MRLMELLGLVPTHKACTNCDWTKLAEEAAHRYHNATVNFGSRVRNNGYLYSKIDFMEGYLQAMNDHFTDGSKKIGG